jgi:cation-transporting ATPase 13A3/4/5
VAAPCGCHHHQGWGTTQRLLEFRCHRYFFLDSHDTFVPVPDVPRGFTSQLQKSASAMAATSAQGAAAGRGAVATEAAITSVLDDHEWDVADRQLRYGANEMRIPVKSIAALVADEMWHPFYVFQYFSILVWVAGDQYYTYAVCIFVITWFSIITGAVETHQNMKRLAQVAQFACKVRAGRETKQQVGSGWKQWCSLRAWCVGAKGVRGGGSCWTPAHSSKQPRAAA